MIVCKTDYVKIDYVQNNYVKFDYIIIDCAKIDWVKILCKCDEKWFWNIILYHCISWNIWISSRNVV